MAATEYLSRRATPSQPAISGEQARDRERYSEYLAQAFSDNEMLVAIDVIGAAISEGRRHVDLEALKRVQAKLRTAHNWKKRTGG